MKKDLLKFLAIAALIAVIGFGFTACGGGGSDNVDGDLGGNPTIGTYTGKDVLGNTYTLSITGGASSSIARSAARAVANGDTYTMTLKARDGKTRTFKAGAVNGVNSDGTISLKPSGAAAAFTATVGGSTLKTVVAGTDDSGNIVSLPITGDENRSTLVPRTFSEIYLRAIRWTNGNKSGEHFGTATSVLVKDFPTRVRYMNPNTTTQYKIKIKGKSDVALAHIQIEIQGLTASNEWKWLANSSEQFSVSAGVPFDKTVDVYTGNDAWSYDFNDYKEIIMQVTNVYNYTDTENPGDNYSYGTIPSSISDGQIGATITDFNITLIDSDATWTGNVPEYTYGFFEDGLSVDYRKAVFTLTSANIAAAKAAGAKFKFKMPYMGSDITTNNPVIDFVWQAPAQGLWWQNQKHVCGGNEEHSWAFEYYNGASWDAGTNTMTIPVSSFVDANFASATEVNFILCYWYGYGDDATDIIDLEINYANIE